MDTKNVIAAISLSAAVLILYGLFFAPEPDLSRIKKDPIEQSKVVESSEAPSLDQNENFSKLTRKEALAENKRVQFENNNIIGSISLRGAIIDDLTFKQYKKKLTSDEKNKFRGLTARVKNDLTQLEELLQEEEKKLATGTAATSATKLVKGTATA